MSTLQEIGKTYVQNVICYGSFNLLVNICLASGTRFITHIPTQPLIPAAMATGIHTLTCATSGTLSDPFFIHIKNYFLKSPYPTPKEKEEAHDNAVITLNVIQLAIATLATIMLTPIVAKELISYREATVFAAINNLSTLAFTFFRDKVLGE